MSDNRYTILNYELEKSENVETTDPDKYLIVADVNNVKNYNIPTSVHGKTKNITLGQKSKKPVVN